MTLGGCKVVVEGRGPDSNNVLDFIFEHSVATPDVHKIASISLDW